jgi:DNA repair protein RecO (recombination protein O)
MLHKTRGLVLHTIKYTDNSVISHIYTENFGRKSFMISGARGKRSSARINLLQHLSILDMEVYIKQTRDLQRVKEIRLHQPFSSLPYHPVKNTVALFVSEILYKTLQEEESNPNLFSWLINAIMILDLTGSGYANFHLLFMLGLTRYLGFFPRGNYSESAEYFDLENGRFTGGKPGHPHFIPPPVSRALAGLMGCSFEEMGRIRLNSELRNVLLTGILDYYRYHLPGMGKIKSFPVLKEIFEK